MNEHDDDLDDLFGDRPAIPTPEAAGFARISESQARAIAVDMGVSRVGTAFAWSRQNVEKLLARLEPEDDEHDTDRDDEDAA